MAATEAFYVSCGGCNVLGSATSHNLSKNVSISLRSEQLEKHTT